MRRRLTTNAFSGDVIILFAMGLFGSYSLFLRLLPNISTLTFIFVFQIVGAAAFFVASGQKRLPKLHIHTLLLLAALAAVAVANDLMYFAAFRNTTVANAAMAHQSVSIFLLLLAPLLLGERTRRSEWLGLIPALLGLAIIYSNGASLHSSKDIVGITLGLLSGLFYTLLIILYRFIPAKKGLNMRVVNLGRYLIGIMILLPFLPWLHLDHVTSKNLVPLVAFGVLFAFIASGIHSFGISRSRSLHASILGKTEPVFAIIYAAVFLHEIPTLNTIVGGALIIGASIWLAFRKESQVSPSETILSA